MNPQDAVEYIINTLKKRGTDKVQCTVMDSEKKELNIDAGEMSLFRTTFNSSVGFTIYKDNCKGSTSINKMDKDSMIGPSKMSLNWQIHQNQMKHMILLITKLQNHFLLGRKRLIWIACTIGFLNFLIIQNLPILK